MDTTAQMLKSTLAPVRVCAIHFRLSRDRVKPCPGLVISQVTFASPTASYIGTVGLHDLIMPRSRSTFRLCCFAPVRSMYTEEDCDMVQTLFLVVSVDCCCFLLLH